ncbi:unnamed protein product, partial [Vicia faba]
LVLSKFLSKFKYIKFTPFPVFLGQLWSESYMKYIKARDVKVNTHLIIRFDRHSHNFIFKVTIDHNGGCQDKSTLPSRWCDCGKFQAFRVPCSHVIVTCMYTHQDALLLLFSIYKSETLFSVYNNDFSVVAKPDYWPAYEGKIAWHNDQMRRNKNESVSQLKWTPLTS